MPLHYLYGGGLHIDSEARLDAHTVIRPINFKTDIEWLAERAQEQVSYGLMCATAHAITFELETECETEKEAAIKSWNTQWSLIFLSTLGQCALAWPLQGWESATGEIKKKILVINRHIEGLFRTPRQFSAEELLDWARLWPAFHELVDNPRFGHAAAVACNNHWEPRVSIRMAAIWSGIEALLDVDQELKFRVSLASARLLEADTQTRLSRFNAVKRLYDLRSKCVHGGTIKPEAAAKGVEDSLALLCDLIRHFVVRGSLLSDAEKTRIFLE